MRFLALLLLMSPLAAQESTESWDKAGGCKPGLVHEGRQGWGINESGPDDDLGTLPKQGDPFSWVYANYVVVQGANEALDGMVATKQVAPGVKATLTFVSLDSLLQLYGTQTQSFTFTFLGTGPLGNMLNGYTSATAPWLENTSGCQSAPCSEPNAICTGWCSGNHWLCVCTTFGAGSGSGSTADKHQRRVEATEKVYPPF